MFAIAACIGISLSSAVWLIYSIAQKQSEELREIERIADVIESGIKSIDNRLKEAASGLSKLANSIQNEKAEHKKHRK